ncbi:PLP-dependent transferase [Fomitiporia mediterranea MF3/22]|uniref:PLP-dependent transferase n=1 Tax=Fomitiporia mediterranea (strain MF3/22) TaxID=694068 RepID=UPI0004408370|nr:PLP-dependent transferase [Fomitiporia mediterranea MF3/22]EJD08144.1 PLP-dependent transferase [Fomitiporia mediterranea MF3/22]
MTSTLDIDKVRSSFPSLKDGYIFADNAGGSQCLESVAARISDYLLNTNVQLGASYDISVRSTNRVADGAAATAELINAASPDEITFASSSTQAGENLARALDKDVFDDEEIIVTGEHEANSGPWKKLAARRGLVLKNWPHTVSPLTPNNPYGVELAIDTLLPLITSKTRLIAFTACSNILGTIVDVENVVKAIRAEAEKHGARKVEVCIDCVAYAPHRRIDVKKWDIDYCFFSYYKVYGPHICALYARQDATSNSCSALTHHFLRVDNTAYKLSPGGAGYELTYAVSAVLPYFQSLSPSGDVDDAFARIAAHEQELLMPLLGYLTSEDARKKGVLIVGSEKVDEWRAPTVSFVVVGERRPVRSADIVAHFDRKGKMGIRYGHFYSYSLVENLRPVIDINDAVVRISLVHYNTVEEVATLISVLKEALDSLV